MESRQLLGHTRGGPAARWWAMFAGDAWVTLVEVAMGTEKGEAEIHLSERDDSSSLPPITERQEELFPGTVEAGKMRVRAVRVADVLPKQEVAAPALLKLDVQGLEVRALEGCEDVLPQLDWVSVECSFVELYAGQAFADEVIAWLRERGFHLAGVF